MVCSCNITSINIIACLKYGIIIQGKKTIKLFFSECIDMLKPGKCEDKRGQGKCSSRPWRMMRVCKKSCYCEGNSAMSFAFLLQIKLNYKN